MSAEVFIHRQLGRSDSWLCNRNPFTETEQQSSTVSSSTLPQSPKEDVVLGSFTFSQ